MQIRTGDLNDAKVIAFLEEHLEGMHEITPPESVHALEIDALRAHDITFWSVWEGDELQACGALKELGPDRGEIKSMRTAGAHRDQGIASRLVEHILSEARRRRYERLLLETGSMSEFAPARALYRKHGFEVCGPFADYEEDPNSVFMEKRL